MAAITNQTMLKLAIFTISLFLCCAGDNADQIKIEEFNVKPGGVQHSFAVDLNGVSCKFTYVCQGGTHEAWLLSIAMDSRGSGYQCVLERKDGIATYLFFQEFSMDVTGAKLVNAEFVGEMNTPMSSNEYKVDYDNNRVSQVDGEFQNNLNRIMVQASKGSRVDL